MEWLDGRQVVPALVELRRKAELMAGAELERTLRRLEHLEGADPRIEHEVVYLTHRIINKLLHEPTVRLKAQAANGIALTQDALTGIADFADRWIIAGLLVRGIHGTVELTGRILRLFQTGNVQTYAFWVLMGVSALLWWVLR